MKNALIFIDTNILLDFYRDNNDMTLKLLDHIKGNTNRFISGNQIEMEFMKNRQKIIGESKQITKRIDKNTFKLPAFLADSKYDKAISSRAKVIMDQQKKVQKKLDNILSNPSKYDPIYRKSKILFDTKNEYYLSETHANWTEIINLAKGRFDRGMPPRKKDDTSIGDAINWEWILFCAKTSSKDIIVVTRDTDYGIPEKELLNDWLLKEFHERVSSKRSIKLTARLSTALKYASISISASEEKAENEFIDAIKQDKHEASDRKFISKLLNEYLSRNQLIETIRDHYLEPENTNTSLLGNTPQN